MLPAHVASLRPVCHKTIEMSGDVMGFAKGSTHPTPDAYLRSNPPSAPRTRARPTEPPIEPPIDLPRLAAAPPTTWLVTERVTLRAMVWPVDSLPRGVLVPKMVPTMAPICPSTPPPPAAPPAAAF